MIQDKKHALDSESILTQIKGGDSKLEYQTDQIVYSQGDPADFVFYVRAGTVKVTVASEAGKEAVVAILNPGHFCGEDCLAGQTLRTATATALTECVLTRMAIPSVLSALHSDAAFSELFAMHLLERNIRMREDLVDHLLNSTEKRLARLLLILANYGKEDRPIPIAPEISQATLADMLGTSRTHVNFFMNKFRHLGFIEYDGDTRDGVRVNCSLMNVLHQKSDIAT